MHSISLLLFQLHFLINAVLSSGQFNRIESVSIPSQETLVVGMHQELNCVHVRLVSPKYNLKKLMLFSVIASGDFDKETAKAVRVKKVNEHTGAVCFDSSFSPEDPCEVRLRALLACENKVLKSHIVLKWNPKKKTLTTVDGNAVFFKTPCMIINAHGKLIVHCEKGLLRQGDQLLVRVGGRAYFGNQGVSSFSINHSSKGDREELSVWVKNGLRVVQKQIIWIE